MGLSSGVGGFSGVSERLDKLLLLGVDLVGLAYSAKSAGYKVYAVDYFADLDLRRVCDRCFSVLGQQKAFSSGRLETGLDASAFLGVAERFIDEGEIDGVLISSGLEDDIDTLRGVDERFGIIGNTPDAFEGVRDWVNLYRGLDELGIPYPRSEVVEGFEEGMSAARDIGFPVVLKPTEGFGGSGISLVESEKGLEKAFNMVERTSENGVIVQEYIRGVDASVSFIASDSGVKVLSLNEQLLGVSRVFQEQPFGYCGNIVPLQVEEDTLDACTGYVEELRRRFQLRGSNGIDIVIKQEGVPVLVEVNPRFQGSLECVERFNDVNMVETHIDASLHDRLPESLNRSQTYITRLLLYAPCRMQAPDLTETESVRNISPPGSIVEGGAPLCSVICEGDNRSQSIQNALKKALSIYNLCSRYP